MKCRSAGRVSDLKAQKSERLPLPVHDCIPARWERWLTKMGGTIDANSHDQGVPNDRKRDWTRDSDGQSHKTGGFQRGFKEKRIRVAQVAYRNEFPGAPPGDPLLPCRSSPPMVGDPLLPISCQYTSYDHRYGPPKSLVHRLKSPVLDFWRILLFFSVHLRRFRPFCSTSLVGCPPTWAPPSSASSATVRGLV